MTYQNLAFFPRLAASSFSCYAVAVWWLIPAPQWWQITIYVGILFFLPRLHCSKLRPALIMGIWSNGLTRREIFSDFKRVTVCEGFSYLRWADMDFQTAANLQSCFTDQNPHFTPLKFPKYSLIPVNSDNRTPKTNKSQSCGFGLTFFFSICWWFSADKVVRQPSHPN